MDNQYIHLPQGHLRDLASSSFCSAATYTSQSGPVTRVCGKAFLTWWKTVNPTTPDFTTPSRNPRWKCRTFITPAIKSCQSPIHHFSENPRHVQILSNLLRAVYKVHLQTTIHNPIPSNSNQTIKPHSRIHKYLHVSPEKWATPIFEGEIPAFLGRKPIINSFR